MNSQYPVSQPHENLVQQLYLMVKARYTLIYIVVTEEEALKEVLHRVATEFESKLLTWDIVRGWDDNGNDKASVMKALTRINQISKSGRSIFVLRDLYYIFANPHNSHNIPVIRELKNLAEEFNQTNNTIIFTSHTVQIPAELREEITVIDFPLPDFQEINYLIEKTVPRQQLKVSNLGREQLVKACQGLSRTRIQRVLAKAVVEKDEINDTDIDAILEEKKQVIRQTEILEFFKSQDSLKSVGGLENLKEWVNTRKNAFTEQARKYGIPNPKGVLLVGIQGTGKSLSAKIIAHEWRLPLLRLDTGRLFGGIVGESESRARQMIKLAEAIAPCVLWIDEIDKGFGNISSSHDGDSGASRRVFGSLITWMQEKTKPVFVVATANNVKILPAELLRKGRFDEIFYLNLPTLGERQDIFKVHLQRFRGANWKDFDIKQLATKADDFSGAEIEQVIIDGMHRGFQSGREFQTQDILKAIEETVPLARIAQQQIEDLILWASQTGARTASK